MDVRKQMVVTPAHRHFIQSRRHFLRRCLVTGSILAAAGLPAIPRATVRVTRAQETDPTSPLVVDTNWLRQRMDGGAAPAVVLDLGDLGAYRDGHLPGAVHSYWLETVERDYPFYGTVLNQFDETRDSENQGKRLSWMRRHGIGPDTDVIAYDHGDGERAARIVWFLHFLGHTRASMLDGGITAWRNAGFDVISDATEAAPSSIGPIVEPQSGFYLSTSQLVDALTAPATLLVDIRTDHERHDTVGGQFGTGVIPGSIRAPWRNFLRQDASGLVDATAARTMLNASGIVPERRSILYGRFGCDTNLMWLILKQAGYPDVSVYDRGWIEWSTRSGLPVEPLP